MSLQDLLGRMTSEDWSRLHAYILSEPREAHARLIALDNLLVIPGEARAAIKLKSSANALRDFRPGEAHPIPMLKQLWDALFAAQLRYAIQQVQAPAKQ